MGEKFSFGACQYQWSRNVYHSGQGTPANILGLWLPIKQEQALAGDIGGYENIKRTPPGAENVHGSFINIVELDIHWQGSKE